MTTRTDGITRIDGAAPPLGRSTGVALTAVLAVSTLLTRLPGITFKRAFNTDEATLAVLGRTIAGPGTIYVDAADHKPPLGFVFYGLVQRVTGSTDLRYIRAAAALLVFGAALVLALEARRRWGERAMWAAGVVAVLAAAGLGPADAQAANFEVLTILPIAAALAWGGRNRSWLAGAAVAVAMLTKQPAAVTAIPVAMSLWRLGRGPAVLKAAGGGVIATLAISAPFGLGRVLEWALLRNDGYLALAPGDLAFGGLRFLAMFGLFAGLWLGGWLLVVAAAVPARAEAPPTEGLSTEGLSPGDRPATGRSSSRRGLRRWLARPDADLWVLLVVSALATVPGLRFFPHYLTGLVPAVALLAGKGAARHRRWVPAIAVVGSVGVIVASALAWYGASLGVAPPEIAAANYVATHTKPGDTVLVWGNLPEIYWRSDRYPAGALTHNNLLTGYSGRRRRLTTDRDLADRQLYVEYVRQVRADRPELVIDVAASGVRGGEYYPLSGYRLLQDFVDQDYEKVAVLDGAVIYRRLDSAGR